MASFRKICFILFLATSSTEAFTTSASRPAAVTALAATNNDVVDSRRNMLKRAGAFAAAVAFTPVVAANALDMDAFANAQVRISDVFDEKKK